MWEAKAREDCERRKAPVRRVEKSMVSSWRNASVEGKKRENERKCVQRALEKGKLKKKKRKGRKQRGLAVSTLFLQAKGQRKSLGKTILYGEKSYIAKMNVQFWSILGWKSKKEGKKGKKRERKKTIWSKRRGIVSMS